MSDLNKTITIHPENHQTQVDETPHTGRGGDDLDIKFGGDIHFQLLSDQYRLEKNIGEGTQGTIHVGVDEVLQRHTAIKSLKPEHLNNQSKVLGFIEEAKITAQLGHPSIIPLHQIMRDEKQGLHISMQLVEGGKTLLDLINVRKLRCAGKKASKKQERGNLFQQLTYFNRVCEAVHYAHNKDIIHLDIKPENIMIGSQREVYLMDWGIAKSLNTKDQTVDFISGTPRFIAPEMLERKPVKPSNDIYALGILLFEIATLEPAIYGESLEEIFEKTKIGGLQTYKTSIRYLSHPSGFERYH